MNDGGGGMLQNKMLHGILSTYGNRYQISPSLFSLQHEKRNECGFKLLCLAVHSTVRSKRAFHKFEGKWVLGRFSKSRQSCDGRKPFLLVRVIFFCLEDEKIT